MNDFYHIINHIYHLIWKFKPGIQQKITKKITIKNDYK